MDKDIDLNKKEAVAGKSSTLFSWKNVIVFLVFVIPLIIGLIIEISQNSIEHVMLIPAVNPMLMPVVMIMNDIILNDWSILLILSLLNALMLFLIITFVSKFRLTMPYVIGALIGVIILGIFIIYGVAVGIGLGGIGF